MRDGHINIRTDSKRNWENGALNSESIGISNVIHRLRIYYQEEADIMVKSKLGSGTEFILVIPKKDPGIIVV